MGPLLFIAYINYLFSISKKAKFITYTDDTSIFLTGSNPDEIIHTANEIMSDFKGWVDYNYLKMNTTKTKAMFFIPPNKQLLTSTNLDIDGQHIELLSTIKSLASFSQLILIGTIM